MTKLKVTVQKYMSTTPHTIGVDQPLAVAHEMMRHHHVRHLPVLRGSKLVGLLSLRDMHLIETLSDVDPGAVTVEEAMSADPYIVAPGDALADVSAQMAEHKYGSAVVLDGNKVVGMLTTVDVCRALAELLRG